MRRREVIAGLGSAVACPLIARAQQTKLPVIGRLIAATLPPAALAAFRQSLAEHGYVKGRNVAILDRLAEGEYDLSLLKNLSDHRGCSSATATIGHVRKFVRS
jgi:putative tryptophan/tyrosine transport system substrate-binding protein